MTTYIPLSEERTGLLKWTEDGGYSLTILAPVYPEPARAAHLGQEDLKKLLREFIEPVGGEVDFLNLYREKKYDVNNMELSFVDWLFTPVEFAESDIENAD